MSRPLALMLLVTLHAPVAAYADGWNATERIPGATPVRVLVNQHPRVYFRLSPAVPLDISIDGPTRLRIVSRLIVPGGGSAPATYRLRLTSGGTVLKESRTESSPAPTAVVEGSKEVLCKSRTMSVDIPAGRQRLALTLDGASGAVVRILTAARRGVDESYVSLTPVAAHRSVTVTEGEKSIPYYSVLAGFPVRIRVVGPTTLELTSRLDFDMTMRGTQRYRLAIRMDGRPEREAAFSTTKSTSATYVDLKSSVPSKLDRTVVPIPEGGHEVSVELVEPRQGAVEVHARIPRPSVGNEE